MEDEKNRLVGTMVCTGARGQIVQLARPRYRFQEYRMQPMFESEVGWDEYVYRTRDKVPTRQEYGIDLANLIRYFDWYSIRYEVELWKADSFPIRATDSLFFRLFQSPYQEEQNKVNDRVRGDLDRHGLQIQIMLCWDGPPASEIADADIPARYGQTLAGNTPFSLLVELTPTNPSQKEPGRRGWRIPICLSMAAKWCQMCVCGRHPLGYTIPKQMQRFELSVQPEAKAAVDHLRAERRVTIFPSKRFPEGLAFLQGEGSEIGFTGEIPQLSITVNAYDQAIPASQALPWAYMDVWPFQTPPWGNTDESRYSVREYKAVFQGRSVSFHPAPGPTYQISKAQKAETFMRTHQWDTGNGRATRFMVEQAALHLLDRMASRIIDTTSAIKTLGLGAYTAMNGYDSCIAANFMDLVFVDPRAPDERFSETMIILNAWASEHEIMSEDTFGNLWCAREGLRWLSKARTREEEEKGTEDFTLLDDLRRKALIGG